MILKAKGFVLRHTRMSDLKEYYETCKDKVMIKNFMSTPKNINEAREEIKKRMAEYKKKRPPGESFVIEINGKFAGGIEIIGLSYGHEKHKAKVSYFLKKEFRGKDLMVEPLKLVTKYAFKKYKLKRIEAFTRTFNKPSMKVLEQAGYKFEGILRKNKCKKGKYLDDAVYAKVR